MAMLAGAALAPQSTGLPQAIVDQSRECCGGKPTRTLLGGDEIGGSPSRPLPILAGGG